jgi:hypothetical protein
VLTTAATRYSQRMVSEGFFGHVAPDGITLARRLSALGYLRPDGRPAGENIGWGQGELSSARSMVTAWMNSPGHRANVLFRSYREIGIGIAIGAPVDPAWGATYTTDFGARASVRRANAVRNHRTRSARSFRGRQQGLSEAAPTDRPRTSVGARLVDAAV